MLQLLYVQVVLAIVVLGGADLVQEVAVLEEVLLALEDHLLEEEEVVLEGEDKQVMSYKL